jgi:hypothetical protein
VRLVLDAGLSIAEQRRRQALGLDDGDAYSDEGEAAATWQEAQPQAPAQVR